MLEQQFIQWSDTIDPFKKEIPIPVYDARDFGLTFFANANPAYDEEVLCLTYANGEVIKRNIDGDKRYLTVIKNGVATDYIHFLLDDNIGQFIAPMECFRVCVEHIFDGEVVKTEYSNLLRLVHRDSNYLSELIYGCHETQFGLPFFDDSNVEEYKLCIALPVRISKPQYKQTDKIYENRNGEQIVLYATINKEYEGETDYIPEEWHEKIVTALSCDEVYINGERVTKSDSYEIDQDNYTYSDCGIRLTRATFKVKTNVTQRNSNC